MSTARAILLEQLELAAESLASDPSAESRLFWSQHMAEILALALPARVQEVLRDRLREAAGLPAERELH